MFRWTIEDDNGGDICAGNDEVTVNIPHPAPPADNPTYCAGAAIPASTAVGTAAATFTWYDAPTAGNVSLQQRVIRPQQQVLIMYHKQLVVAKVLVLL